MKKKLRFIINPHSGASRKHGIPDMIANIVDSNLFDFEISFTDAPKHATVLSKEAADENYYAVIAVGGDGSVNEVAKSLKGTQTALGIIATGSGNGMARHLKLSMKPEQALHDINSSKVEVIDTMIANEEFCIGTIGVGFDAHIAHLFANYGKRGYSSYVKLVLREFRSYQPRLCEMNIDGKELSQNCFLLTFANSSQFGNNAVIAPFASVKDGLMDISMLRKFPAWVALHLIYRLMNNHISRSRYFEMANGKTVLLKNNSVLQGHIDGEPVTFSGDLKINLVPRSLHVLVSSK